MTKQEQELLKEMLREVLQECGPSCHCNLEAVGITPAEHQEHHKTFHLVMDDFRKLRTALLLFMSTGLIGAMGTAIWWAFRHHLVKG